MPKHTTRKSTRHGKAETMRRREIRTIKYTTNPTPLLAVSN